MRRGRPTTCRRSSTRSSSTRGPARSATARCSSCRSRRPTASARASPARRPPGPPGRSGRRSRGMSARDGGAADAGRRPPPPAGTRRAAARRPPADARGRARRRRARRGRRAGRRGGRRRRWRSWCRGSAPRSSRRAAARPTLAALRRYVADRAARTARCRVPGGVVGRGADPLRRRRRRRGRAAARRPAVRGGRASSCSSRRSPALTEVAVEEAKEEVEQNLRGSFLEDLRVAAGPRARGRSSAAPRGWAATCRGGAVVLCAELTTDRPRHVVATIAGEHPGALAQHMDGRVYALLPATGGDEAPEATLGAARRAGRRGCSATAPSASRASTPTRPSSARAIQEAELVLDVLRQSGAPIAEDIGTGHLPAAVPRARLAPRGGALLLRGHGRADRPLRRPVPHRPRRHARGLPRAQLQHERDRRGDLRAPPHGRLPARAREGAHGPGPDASPRTASGSGSG